MEKRTEDLFEEILKNARSDRKTVEKVRDELIKLTSQPEVMVEGMAMITVAENVAKLSDVLTKMNAQLVELTKVSVKTEAPTDVKKVTDADSIFDEIEMSGTTDQTN